MEKQPQTQKKSATNQKHEKKEGLYAPRAKNAKKKEDFMRPDAKSTTKYKDWELWEASGEPLGGSAEPLGNLSAPRK